LHVTVYLILLGCLAEEVVIFLEFTLPLINIIILVVKIAFRKKISNPESVPIKEIIKLSVASLVPFFLMKRHANLDLNFISPEIIKFLFS